MCMLHFFLHAPLLSSTSYLPPFPFSFSASCGTRFSHDNKYRPRSVVAKKIVLAWSARKTTVLKTNHMQGDASRARILRRNEFSGWMDAVCCWQLAVEAGDDQRRQQNNPHTIVVKTKRLCVVGRTGWRKRNRAPGSLPHVRLLKWAVVFHVAITAPSRHQHHIKWEQPWKAKSRAPSFESDRSSLGERK